MKKITSLFLALLLCLSLCAPVFATQSEGDPLHGRNISELFSLLGHTDGSGSEDLSYELYQAFQADPGGFIRAAAELPSGDLTTMTNLLVYFAGYFDLDDFRNQVVSCGDDMLTESEQNVVEEILREVDRQQSEGDSFQADPLNGRSISELFSLLGHTDGSGSEDLSYELYQAFQADPGGFIRVAAELPSGDLTTMANLLVYFAGYFDLDDFRNQVVSCGDDMLTESEQNVVEEILREVDLQQNQTVPIEPADPLPEPPKYNPYFLEKLISSHVDNNNFEDEEFFETLSNVFIEDPATFSAVMEDLSAAARDTIVAGVAKACVNSGKIFSWENSGELTGEKTDIISAVQEKIMAIGGSASERIAQVKREQQKQYRCIHSPVIVMQMKCIHW